MEFSTRNEARQFVKTRRADGYTINIALNKSKYAITRAINEQFVPQATARLTIKKSLADAAAKSVNFKALRKAARVVQKSKIGGALKIRRAKRRLQDLKNGRDHGVHHVEIELHYNHYSRNIHVWLPLTTDEIASIPSPQELYYPTAFLTLAFALKLNDGVRRLLEHIYETPISVPNHNPEPEHEIEARDWRDTVLMNNQFETSEPWIVSDFAVCGDVRHAMRKNSCLINAIMTVKDKVVNPKGAGFTPQQFKAIFKDEKSLYEYITDQKIEDGQPMPLTLAQCEEPCGL